MSTPLRKFRKDRNETLQTLSETLEVSESQLSRIEREGTHSLPTAIKLSGRTGLPVEAFAPTDEPVTP